MHLYDLNNAEFEVVGGRKRLTISGEAAEFAMVEREPGAADGHSHPNEQFVYFLEGKAEFHVGDEKQTVGAGQVLHIPANIQHGIKPLSHIRYVTVYAPGRDASQQEAKEGKTGHHLAG